MPVEGIVKHAYVMGAQRALIDLGVLRPWGSLEKEAQAAGMAAQGMPPQGMPPQGMPPQGMPPQPTPEEMAAVGQTVTPQDLESLAKILDLLAGLQQQYMMQQQPPPQGMPPQGMPPQGMPPQGMMPPGPPM